MKRRPRIRFILPCVGRIPGQPYIRTWQMEPLSIARLSAMTPPDIAQEFFDDRLEEIPYGGDPDLVALSVETYTARRAYQIAARYREQGVPVVMGGFHATLRPEEAAGQADAVVIGEAEAVWPQVVGDALAGRLQARYAAPSPAPLADARADRSIYATKNYLDLALVETARGCRYHCEFCSISAFFRAKYRARPIEEVVAEVRALKARNLFFVDDNFAADAERTRCLLEALAPLRRRWVAQVALNVAGDEAMLRLMKRSGCSGVLIGFESLDQETLRRMGKGVNLRGADLYTRALDRLRRHGIAVYGTFVFGYDNDTEDQFRRTLDFAVRHGLFFAAFNHLVPFPGTPVYERLRQEGRLVSDPWWLSDGYRFGDVAFHPRQMSAERLADLCYEYRRRFYALSSIARRARNWRANCTAPLGLPLYLALNLAGRRDAVHRQGLPLGIPS